MQARRPQEIPDEAELCLEALAAHGLGEIVSIGGAFGLLHYLDYRSTRDLDAWWQPSSSRAERDRVIAVVRSALETVGEVQIRSWGEVVSIELKRDGTKIFSFQIAERSAQLAEAKPAPGTTVLLDSFVDLVASKMVALVERGAPRDFRDIHALCEAKLITAGECWDLWQRRQEESGDGADHERARVAVQTHLARIIAHRPLSKIVDRTERRAAERVRTWFSEEFLDELD